MYWCLMKGPLLVGYSSCSLSLMLYGS
uniref:Uncharacterized protein n=1 Tax=Anguilla anguilla TaxID=7936 RepID=A0A0E9QAZ0_ANGAN